MLFIIWKGRGPLVILSMFLGSMIVLQSFSFLSIDTSRKSNFIFQGIVMTVLITLINYLLTKKFVSNKIRIFIDQETGERISIRDNSSLFFIPNRYWTWIIFIGGLILTIGASTSVP